MKILAIDTSCDETAAALVDGERVLSNVVWDQLKLHRRWGGVVPHLARRAHQERLPVVVSEALKRAKINFSPPPSVKAIAVTYGPGLSPALEVGVAYAQRLALQHHLPLIPVNHLEGHIASVFLRNRRGKYFVKSVKNFIKSAIKRSPVGATLRRVDGNHRSSERMTGTRYQWINLIVSGGHTEIVQSTIKPLATNHQSLITHRLLGQTMDDAAGECLDKVGRELGLGYPAAPVIEKLAKETSKGKKFNLPLPMLKSPKENLDFSFSGLKTAAVQRLHGTHDIEKFSLRSKKVRPSSHFRPKADPALRETIKPLNHLSKTEIFDFCFAFQDAVIEALLLKTRRAVTLTGINTVLLSGGVAANNRLRHRLSSQMRSRVPSGTRKLDGKAYLAPKKFCGDNAAMIGLAAHWAINRGEILTTEEEIKSLDRHPSLNFEKCYTRSNTHLINVRSAF